MLAWVIVPITSACFLYSTGRLEGAHILSALAWTGIITVVAANSGGIHSFAATWLVLIPMEAALSGSRRVVATAALLAFTGAALSMVAAGPLQFVPPPGPEEVNTMLALGIVSALLYATGLALGAEAVWRAKSRLLVREEERCRLLAGNMADVVIRHGIDGRVLFVSPNAEAALGAAAHRLVGYGLLERIHPADRAGYLNAMTAAGASADPCTVEFRMLQDDAGGSAEPPHIWVEMRCRPFAANPASTHDSDNCEIVAVVCDVTRRKAEQQALIHAHAEAERANAAKSRFLAVVSHELRTPLNAIIGFSEMLCKEAEMRFDGRRRQEYSRLINELGYHLLAVVNDILDASRLETGDFEITSEPFKLGPLMTSCHALFSLKAKEANVEFCCEVPPGLPDIVADKRAVKQILINLISNAIKFTDRGGTVTLAAVIDGQHIILSVEDTGIGIAAEDLARIGAPFFQARGNYARKHDGAGLGLSIVKGLATLHGGGMEIVSRPGVGTRIAVRLPLDCECALGAVPRIDRKADGARGAAMQVADTKAGPPGMTPSLAFCELRGRQSA